MRNIYDDIKAAMTLIDFSNLNENKISSRLTFFLIGSGYQNIKQTYQQDVFRVKNLANTKPDIALQLGSETYLIETKLQPESGREALRFQRAFIDVAYLYNEINTSGIKGCLLYIDKSRSRYLEKNHFKEAVEKVLPIELISDGWHDCKKGKWEYKIIEIVIKQSNDEK